MSTCADINELLSDHLDDRLDPATLSKVETHLGRCPSCSAELEAWRLIGERMRAAPPEPVAPEFASRIRAAAQAPRPRRGVKFFLQRAAAAVLLLATLVTSYFIGHHEGRANARADDLVRLGSTPIPWSNSCRSTAPSPVRPFECLLHTTKARLQQVCTSIVQRTRRFHQCPHYKPNHPFLRSGKSNARCEGSSYQCCRHNPIYQAVPLHTSTPHSMDL